MYLTYDEYKSYGGTLSVSAFDVFSFKAKIKIDYHTNNRLTKDTEFSNNIKFAVKEIIDLLSTYDNYQKAVADMEKPVISSQSNDGVSVSYGGYLGNTSPGDLKTLSDKLENDITRVIKQYLINETNQSGEFLLYRGVC